MNNICFVAYPLGAKSKKAAAAKPKPAVNGAAAYDSEAKATAAKLGKPDPSGQDIDWGTEPVSILLANLLGQYKVTK